MLYPASWSCNSSFLFKTRTETHSPVFRQVEEKDAWCVCPSEILPAVLASVTGKFLTWVGLENNAAIAFLRGNVINLVLTEKKGLRKSVRNGPLRIATPWSCCLLYSAS